MRARLAPTLAGALLVLAGVAGLVRGSGSPAAASGPAAAAAPIVVTNAYVRPPLPPTDAAAAYFTVYNTTGRDDRLIAVATGAGATSVLHTAGMTAAANGAVIPAHGSLVLSTGQGHVMIEQLFGKLRPGQTVNLDLTFENAGSISVTAQVIAPDAPAPTGSSEPAPTGSSAPSTGVTK
jgi:hypothetical protein